MERGAEETRKPGLGLVSELNLYYLLVALYFLAFGMQFVLFPSLVAFNLDATPAGVGLAQSALSAPMFCLLLFGGLLAERARPSTTIALLYLGFAFTTLILCAVVAAGQLTYSFLITYAVIVGSCAAFAMPVRDAALNGIVAREAELGKHTPIATAAAVTTAVQIGAQIAAFDRAVRWT
ncbi:MAG: MFS transporter [Caulobacteraceae bacterium]|nr:MFS transporter [Caulobacteraceae bacterium]